MLAEAIVPDLSTHPVRIDRETGAALVTKLFFRVSPRSLERWPVSWRTLNGRAHCETAELFAVAEAMLREATPVMGGRRMDRPATSIAATAV